MITIAIAGLDEGEKQAIALASTFSEELVLLLDDSAGRRVAQKLGFSTTGSIWSFASSERKRSD